MIRNYPECVNEMGTAYEVKKAVESGKLYRIEKGVYADTPSISTLAIITTKYPNAIITLDTAFYYHNLTDVIPEHYYLATRSSARGIRDKRVKQIFIKDDFLNQGVVTMKRRDAEFKVYDRERMLIELIRFKNKLPYDYYKEILNNYRSLLYELDIERVQEYAATFPKSKTITEILDREVF